jgi:hypothetical protein
MGNISQGLGWSTASDGKRCPPEQNPDIAVPISANRGCCIVAERRAKRILLSIVGCVGMVTLLAACGNGATTAAAAARDPSASTTTSARPVTSPSTTTSTTLPEPAAGAGTTSTTTSTSSTPSVPSIDSAVCAAALPNPGGGDHCAVSYLKVSTVDGNWVFAAIGLYNTQNQPESDMSDVIFNLGTHQLIVSDESFCGVGTGSPVPGYSSVPAKVLAGFGLRPCSSSTTTTMLPPTTKGVLPLLGSAAWGKALGSFAGISGFGLVAPAAISLGGLASSPHVSSISWSDWGAAQAIGQGQSIDGTGQSGPVSSWPVEPATVVAFDLGSCDGGPPAYQKVTWYFPKDGQTFDPTTATNACTGR